MTTAVDQKSVKTELPPAALQQAVETKAVAKAKAPQVADSISRATQTEPPQETDIGSDDSASNYGLCSCFTYFCSWISSFVSWLFGYSKVSSESEVNEPKNLALEEVWNKFGTEILAAQKPADANRLALAYVQANPKSAAGKLFDKTFEEQNKKIATEQNAQAAAAEINRRKIDKFVTRYYPADSSKASVINNKDLIKDFRNLPDAAVAVARDAVWKAHSNEIKLPEESKMGDRNNAIDAYIQNHPADPAFISALRAQATAQA